MFVSIFLELCCFQSTVIFLSCINVGNGALLAVNMQPLTEIRLCLLYSFLVDVTMQIFCVVLGNTGVDAVCQRHK